MPSPSSKVEITYTYREWVFPTLGFVWRAHDRILLKGPGRPGVADEGLLLSALSAPLTSAGCEDAYPRLFDKVAALGYRIAKNHGFNDANKRTALLTIRQTLAWQRLHPVWSEDTQVLVLSLVGAGHLDQEGLLHALILGYGYDPVNDDIP